MEDKNKRMSPLTNIKHMFLSQSTKVRDMYITRHKQKHNLLEDVVKENTINLLKERTEYEKDIFLIKAKQENKTQSKANSQTNKTNRNIIKFDKKAKDVQVQHSKVKQTNNSNKPEGKTVDNLEKIDIKNKEKIPPDSNKKCNNQLTKELNRNDRSNNQNHADKRIQFPLISSLGRVPPYRPQTPKVRKSVKIRDGIKQLSAKLSSGCIKSTIDLKTNTTIEKKSPSEISQTVLKSMWKQHVPQLKPPQQTYPLETCKKTVELKSILQVDKNRCAELSQQLLHPLWRRIPHRPLYGWSKQHERLESILYTKITNGQIECAYYKTDTEYSKAQTNSDTRFLQKPIVNNTTEILQLLQCYEKSPGTLPSIRPLQDELDDTDDVESGYDGDEE